MWRVPSRTAGAGPTRTASQNPGDYKPFPPPLPVRRMPRARPRTLCSAFVADRKRFDSSLRNLRISTHPGKLNTPKAIASQTGGEYELFESRKRFETRMIDFTNHLHNRYVLSFEPKNPKPGLHEIRVRLKEPGTATVLARSSYWVAAPAQ